jgi:DNA polymerase-4
VNELKKKHLAIWKKLIGAHLCCRSLPLTAHEPQNRSFSRETTFPHDIGDVNMLMSHLAYLVDRLSVYLLQEKLYAGRVEVKVRFSDFSTFTKRLALDFPSFSFSELWKKSSLLLEALRTKKSLPLRLVGVKVENISPYRDLLPFISIRGEQLSRGVFAVKDKFGFSAIYTARELLLRQLYPKTDQGLVLKTASLTK